MNLFWLSSTNFLYVRLMTKSNFKHKEIIIFKTHVLRHELIIKGRFQTYEPKSYPSSSFCKIVIPGVNFNILRLCNIY